MTDDAWRPMAPADLEEVERVGAEVHPDHREEPGILAGRQLLYPAGCFVLARGEKVHGYAFAHPWHFGQPPKLNTRLHRLPDDADTFYVHDLALVAGMRGRGFGDAAVALLMPLAERFASTTLIAVGASAPFWQRHGFVVATSPSLRPALSSYGPQARFMVRLA